MTGIWRVFRMNLKVLVLVLIFLLLADQIFLYVYRHRVSGDGVYRLAAEDKLALKLYLSRIQQDDHPKVVMLGDSVMFGSAVKPDYETIPAQVAKYLKQQRLGRDVHVYNLGLKGMGTADAYYLLKWFKDHPTDIDLLIYDVNIGWLTDKNVVNRTLILGLYPPDTLDWQQLKQPKPAPEPQLTSWVNNHVLPLWKVYQYRLLISDWLFGKPMADRVKEEATAVYHPGESAKTGKEDEIYQSWRTKSWDASLKGDWKLGAVPTNTIQWSYFIQLLDVMGETSERTLLFYASRNMELLREYDKMDPRAMAATKKLIDGEAQRRGFQTADFETLVDSSYFSDTIHPLKQGNQKIGKELADLIVRRKFLE